MKRGAFLLALGTAAALLSLAGRSAGETAKKRGDELVTGPPSTKRVSSVTRPKGGRGVGTDGSLLLLDGKPVGAYPGANPPPAEVARARELAREVRASWKLRQTALPKDADRQNADRYSKELYWIPAWLFFAPLDKITAAEILAGGNGMPVDEFGRPLAGHYGNGPRNIWDQTFGGLLKNPLFKTAVLAAAVASGPQGAALYGAYSMWEARGKNLTAQNALLTAGRAYVVSQCGEACGVAFDFGVGVASGKSAGGAAEDALLQELTPAQRDAYEAGKREVRKVVS